MVDFWVRLFGVDGAATVSAVGEVFLFFRDWAGATGGGMAEAWALRRADLLLDMVKCAMDAGSEGCRRDEMWVGMGR